ncbi:hypothetical protein SM077_002579 [Cronobacter sakazakii]|nr:hypothetical protein [Cronobacter sakazakii]
MQLNVMPLSELLTTANNYAASIKELGIYSDLVKELCIRLDAGSIARREITKQRDALAAECAPLKPILSRAIADIIAERQRQKEKKGYTESRDDNYLPGVLNLAGAAYAVSASCLPDAKRRADRLWPWPEAGKYLNASSKDPRSALIKAAALIAAEIERIDRAELRKGGAA